MNCIPIKNYLPLTRVKSSFISLNRESTTPFKTAFFRFFGIKSLFHITNCKLHVSYILHCFYTHVNRSILVVLINEEEGKGQLEDGLNIDGLPEQGLMHCGTG